ncbi:MAG TPA: hypothetical protein VEO54_21835 [Thermoanaerobaculia bacterium]|nr:hypothetical protein [Thermoanaerobaculia bacterium]
MTVLEREACTAPRPVVAAAGYAHSRAALDRIPNAERVAAALESLAAARPEDVDPVPGTIVRVLRAHRYGDFPALRLYYSVDAVAVRLLRIEEWDAMEA